MTRLFVPLILFALSASAETVRFPTDDGLEIVADFHLADADGPTVVCIPMFRNVRGSYEPLVKPIVAKKINVLLLDTRGHGESAPDLRKRVEGRDAALFNAMHKDVEAAIAFLEREKGCDPTRIGLVGASVGCSVAVDVTVRNPQAVRAVVLLTPGANYLGVPTLEHLARWPGTRVFAFSSFEEEKTTKPVVEALKPHDGTNFMYFDESGIHGTRMFGKVTAIEELIANFMEGSLLGKMDFRVPQWREGDPALGKAGFFGRTLRPRRTVDGTTYSLMAYAVGDTLHLGGLVDKPFRGKLRFYIAKERIEFPFDSEAPDPAVKRGGGEQASFRGTSWITVSRPGAGSHPLLAVEFLPAEGEAVRIPGRERFAAILEPVSGK